VALSGAHTVHRLLSILCPRGPCEGTPGGPPSRGRPETQRVLSSKRGTDPHANGTNNPGVVHRQPLFDRRRGLWQGLGGIAGRPADRNRNGRRQGSSPFPINRHYVDNNLAPTIASNLLEANAVLSWQASCQRAKRCGPLLCATIGHIPACYTRQFLLSATHHAAE
jgi:hypothetical protein